jgi:hypothetical protein
MPTLFSIQGSTISLRDPETLNLHDKLPPEVFTVREHPLTGELLLERIENFTIPAKRYGHNDKYAERILYSYEARAAATGVLLCGEKGSGKSLLAKTLACKAQEKGLPTIVINVPRTGDAFFNMLQRIEQPGIILFDEFEKVYDAEKQKEVLTLLDGIYPSNKLYIFTVNDKWKLDVNMRNRPGRIFYSIDYKSIEEQFIREYCEDNLNDKTQVEHIVRIKTLFSAFNFDMLQALVEEMNRFKEDPFEAIRLLNIKPEYEDANTYNVVITVDGHPDTHISCERDFVGKPLGDRFKIYYHRFKRLDLPKDHEDNESDWLTAEFTPTDLVATSKDGRTFLFKNSRGENIKLTAKERESAFDYRAFAYGPNES